MILNLRIYQIKLKNGLPTPGDFKSINLQTQIKILQVNIFFFFSCKEKQKKYINDQQKKHITNS